MRALETMLPSRPLWPGIATILIAALAVAALAWTQIDGPELRAEQEQQLAADIAAEGDGVCQRLGILKDSAGFANCTAELEQVRQRHEDRLQHLNSLL